MSSVSYLPQPGTAKIKMFCHDFEGFHLKKQNVEVKKGIGLCCVGFLFILMVLSQAAQAHHVWVRASEVICSEYTRIISILSDAK